MKLELDALKILAQNTLVPGVALRDTISEIEKLNTQLKLSEMQVSHLTELNKQIDNLGPLVVQAIRRITPKTITDDAMADHKLASELRIALDAMTDVQNRDYREKETVGSPLSTGR